MQVEKGLAGKVGVVSGAGRGIGRVTTEAMLAAGMQVVGADLEVDELSDRATADPKLVVMNLDLTAPGGPRALIDEALGRFGSVDVLVNNIADIGSQTAFTDVSDEAWEHGLAVNLMATVRLCRAAVPHMRAAGAGSIVMVGSDAGELPDAGFAPYSVSKAALMNLSKMLSNAYGRDGIRSNVVAPGLTRTYAVAGLLDSLAAEHGDEATAIAAFTESIGMALPRLGEPEEVAAIILFLASDHAMQITGAVVRMDGGAVPAV